MKIRQIKITNHTTQEVKYREVTEQQHKDILRRRAMTNAPLQIEMIKEREV